MKCESIPIRHLIQPALIQSRSTDALFDCGRSFFNVKISNSPQRSFWIVCHWTDPSLASGRLCGCFCTTHHSNEGRRDPFQCTASVRSIRTSSCHRCPERMTSQTSGWFTRHSNVPQSHWVTEPRSPLIGPSYSRYLNRCSGIDSAGKSFVDNSGSTSSRQVRQLSPFSNRRSQCRNGWS